MLTLCLHSRQCIFVQQIQGYLVLIKPSLILFLPRITKGDPHACPPCLATFLFFALCPQWPPSNKWIIGSLCRRQGCLKPLLRVSTRELSLSTWPGECISGPPGVMSNVLLAALWALRDWLTILQTDHAPGWRQIPTGLSMFMTSALLPAASSCTICLHLTVSLVVFHLWLLTFTSLCFTVIALNVPFLSQVDLPFFASGQLLLTLQNLAQRGTTPGRPSSLG
jgi:hypothetical protein